MTAKASTEFGFLILNLSPLVDDQLKFLLGRQSSSKSQVIHRCIAAGDLVKREREAKRQIFAGGEKLDLPEPDAIRKNLELENLELWVPLFIHPLANRAFNEIGESYALDPQSVLAWCIRCFEIIDEAVVTKRLTDGNRMIHLPKWITP